MVGGRDRVHEACKIFSTQSLHSGVNIVDKVETRESFRHSWVLASVDPGVGAVEDMEAHIDVGASHTILLLVPFDSFKLYENRGERIDCATGEMCAVVVP